MEEFNPQGLWTTRAGCFQERAASRRSSWRKTPGEGGQPAIGSKRGELRLARGDPRLSRACSCGTERNGALGASNATISSHMNINKSLGFTGPVRLAQGNSPVSDLQYNLCFLNQDYTEIRTYRPWSHSTNLGGQKSWFMIEIAGGENGKVWDLEDKFLKKKRKKQKIKENIGGPFFSDSPRTSLG